MKNMVLKYSTEEVDDFIVSDYFSKDVNLCCLLETNLEEYLQIYQCLDNDKYERISYELYGTPDYWDIITLLNDRNTIFQMPLDSDALVSGSSDFINNYISNVTDIIRRTELTQEWEDEFVANNEEYRILYVIKPNKMSEFITLLKTNNFI